MTDALKDEFPDPETELAFLDFLATEWPNWRHHVGSDYWHIRRRSFLAGRSAPQALAATPAVGGEREELADKLDGYATLYASDYGYDIAADLKNAAAALRAQPASPLRGRDDLQETISNAIMKIVSNRDDLGYTHFIEIRDSIFAAIAAQPASPLRGRKEALQGLSVGLDEIIQRTVDPAPTLMSDRNVLNWVNGKTRQLYATLAAALSASSPEQPAADPNNKPLIEPFTGNYRGTKE